MLVAMLAVHCDLKARLEFNDKYSSCSSGRSRADIKQIIERVKPSLARRLLHFFINKQNI